MFMVLDLLLVDQLMWRDQELQWRLPACSGENANESRRVTLLQGKESGRGADKASHWKLGLF